MIQRSDDGGATWTEPTFLAQGSVNHGMVSVAPDGTVWAVWLEATGYLPSTSNRVLLARSSDGGASFDPPIVVSAGEPLLFADPNIAASGTAVYVAYNAGRITGAIDLLLATTTDGGASFTHRKVSDEPDACASNVFSALAADDAAAHVAWIDNRFGNAELVYASCPPSGACSANELIDEMPFALTFDRMSVLWLGDYTGLTEMNGELWFLFAASYPGRAAMFVARGALQ